MRHRVAGNRMNMPEPRRRSARRSLMEGLIRYDRINTTKARARAIRGEVEKLITVAVKAAKALQAAYEAMVIELHARRLILRTLPDELVVKKMFEELAPRYLGRPGGYTRITKLGRRKGDAAEIAQIALV